MRWLPKPEQTDPPISLIVWKDRGWKMGRFADIFEVQTLDHQSETNALNEKARAAGWNVLHPGESVRLDDDTRSIVISGVTWSKPDLEVLDELAARDTSDTQVWFFSLDYVFPDERILPNAPSVIRTPVLAEYSGRQLVNFVQGRGVIDRIRNLFRSR
jgi:hypothetical protein